MDSLTLEYILRLGVTAILSIVIGMEREMHGRAAGIRTTFLVGMGAAVFTIISFSISSETAAADPARIAAQIVTGVGFLGAGTIVKSGFSIKGLTTAACMWIVASIGMAAGAGYYLLAIFATIISLLCLILFPIICKAMPRHSYRMLYVKKTDSSDFDQVIELVKTKLSIGNIDYELDFIHNEYVMRANVRLFHTGETDKVLCEIKKLLIEDIKSITAVRWSSI